ncbi:hypothetical protein GCK72_017052 [Caenorhabditis remanei]|uniref:Uncharacterized protein n=1 Tax=Caenorhabditis remanei TaxID=31234 RepID=A0A6A5G729_CAERE|nr:hypothetical protein GCK72_017052 [Caenorhabditis remanei]KAF1750502.1 hypothetical protein GCK72_017052 [Caenorhabditis remanei]
MSSSIFFSSPIETSLQVSYLFFPIQSSIQPFHRPSTFFSQSFRSIRIHIDGLVLCVRQPFRIIPSPIDFVPFVRVPAIPSPFIAHLLSILDRPFAVEPIHPSK